MDILDLQPQSITDLKNQFQLLLLSRPSLLPQQ